jgi:hypothetical protein
MASSPHTFRYELELCTLPEGATLSQWRRGYDDPLLAQGTAGSRARRRPGLMRRLRTRRRPSTS